MQRFAALLVTISIILFYSISPYSHAPLIDETQDMTSPPSEFQQVLGLSTSLYNESTSFKIPILMYHYVENVLDPNDKIRVSLNITPVVFESQIKTLKDNGYTFLTASALTYILSKKVPLPKKSILITFDDGYRDFYTDAYPILKKYHVAATQYVISGFLDRPNHLLTSQLKEISRDGLIEIGAHTVNHFWLRGIDNKIAAYEIGESKKRLEKLLDRPISSFAYPYGAFDQQTVEFVKEAGFSNAVTTIAGDQATAENKFLLYRLRPGYRTGNTLISYISSF